ncbi:unnamed protein product [Anisakis simplex]|uniref:Transposase n=1 Tax=Anisakis simplex TaxID=6269 RepID=A0A0M3KJZ8_ANISI|nr:unnamed protein product [Anisakis simplex]
MVLSDDASDSRVIPAIMHHICTRPIKMIQQKQAYGESDMRSASLTTYLPHSHKIYPSTYPAILLKP